MNRKISREELKRDEILDTFSRGWRYFADHRSDLVKGTGIVVALGLAIGAFLWVRSYRERQAAHHLSRALEILSAPLLSDPQASGAATAFATAQERQAAADKELQAAADSLSTAAGRQARLVLDAETPQKAAPAELEKLAARSTSATAALAELDAIRAMAAQGHVRDAIAKVRQAIETNRSALPKDALLFELGDLYLQDGSTPDARSTYEQLVNGYPDSPYAQEAQRKLGSL